MLGGRGKIKCKLEKKSAFLSGFHLFSAFSFPATATFLTNVRNRRLPLHSHQRCQTTAKPPWEGRALWETEEEKRSGGEQSKKNTEKKEERSTTIPAILWSATANSTAFRATTGQPSAPYLVLLFIFLHAERALCTFCKQENNYPVTVHVHGNRLIN